MAKSFDLCINDDLMNKDKSVSNDLIVTDMSDNGDSSRDSLLDLTNTVCFDIYLCINSITLYLYRNCVGCRTQFHL